MTETTAIDQSWFRRVLGRYPTGVCAITALDPGGGPTGMTVGSFTSVSLEPELVAFLPAKSSTSWPLIREAGNFCANVLAADQEHVCRAFATRGGQKFEGLNWRLSAGGAPIIDGSVAWIDCAIEQVLEAGDHYIVIAGVRALDLGRIAPPLVFYHGRYGGADLPIDAPGTDDAARKARL
jgi:3-hydroxy-9,10-secoandrosta-1,3,5(10)-triene-9,17-dione monooxygenase reductase component